MVIDPKEDGYTHLNIYSKAHTQLGRDLSNFSDYPLEHPKYGRFASMEGFYYWVSTGGHDESFRELVGYDAKKHGESLEKVEDSEFQKKICEGLLARFDTNPDLKKRFIETTLPFVHYYYYGKDIEDVKVVEPITSDFMMQYLRSLRRYLRKEENAIEIYTIQLGKHALAKKRRIPVLDTTVKSGDKTFSPTWEIVTQVKDGSISPEEYRERYIAMMRESWKVNNDRWMEVINGGRVAFACYCREGDFCHRHILKEIFLKIARFYNRPIVDVGEIN